MNYKTEDQVDDTFTKVFHRDQFEKNILKLGLIRINLVFVQSLSFFLNTLAKIRR